MPESKKYKAAVALFDREQQYTPTEAVSIVKKTASKKFDESVDIAVRLGVDPRKADQAVRGTVALPAGSGKTLRIAVIAAGGFNPGMLEVPIVQLVSLTEGGEAKRMSKRAGTLVTLGELIDDIGVDAARFFLVQRSHETAFDLDLEERVGRAIGRELRATGADLTGAVCVNLLRHPAWGRAQETYGEDPHHVGEMGAALTRGLQTRVMATVKHFALNSMENARFTVDVTCAEEHLHEVYLPHFLRIVDEGVACVMSAYNSVNGDYCGENRVLLTEILREEWGFEGFVISDWIFGLRDGVRSVEAGLDVEMPYRMIRHAPVTAAVAEGVLPVEAVDARVTATLATMLRFGLGALEPEPIETLVAEIEGLPPECRLFETKEYVVYAAEAERLPHVLHEIGRQRELAFRAVGEGTGKPLDLDRFDPDYHHLFVWNPTAREIVGSYRIGVVEDIVRRRGLDGLYTTTLFHYDHTLLDSLGPALELGRSFVRAEYQRSFGALHLLWCGIGRFVAQRPRHRHLMGAVSISDAYSTMSQQLMTAFLESNHMCEVRRHKVRPRNPVAFEEPSEEVAAELPNVTDLESLSERVQRFEGGQRDIPVLLRRYLGLGGRILGVNRDPDFANVVDGLVVIDLLRAPRRVVERYLGADGLRAVAAAAGESSSVVA